jgi:hypothetical protein
VNHAGVVLVANQDGMRIEGNKADHWD